MLVQIRLLKTTFSASRTSQILNLLKRHCRHVGNISSLLEEDNDYLELIQPSQTHPPPPCRPSGPAPDNGLGRLNSGYPLTTS